MMPTSERQMMAAKRNERCIDAMLMDVYKERGRPKESLRRDQMRQHEKKSTAEIPCGSCILFKTCEKRRKHRLTKCKYGVRNTENTSCKTKTHLI